ncbi:MAG: T9SS type A sorting domain-containing protein [Bacteroidetes bacterium]|nr:T9SS type A sorting domain-containing protein [Bacteroidota bacterium]
MRKYILLLLFCSSLTGISQTTGVTTHTSNRFTNDNLNTIRQIVSQSPNGDIWIYDFNGGLVKFSGNTFTTYTNTFGVLPDMNVFGTNTGAWMFSNYGFFYYYNGSTFIDYSSNITSLIGTLSSANPINYIGNNGTDILIATNKGIIKYNGSTFSIINASNSNLACDTVSCILSNGATTFIGTDKGLCTYNGSTFSALITFSGAATHAVSYIFSNGVKTIVIRKSSTSDFDYYNLNANQLIRIPAFPDSVKFTSKKCRNISFVNNNPAFPSIYAGNNIRVTNSVSTYTDYSGLQGSFPMHSFKHPSNSQKFYAVATDGSNSNKFVVNEIDVTNYATLSISGSPNQVKYLDTNNVNALISEVNIKHCDIFGNGGGGYIVPKNPLNNMQSPVFATALWVGGLDNTNQIHMAAQTYRQTGYDFWPGPLDTINGQTSVSSGSPYNKVWKISCNQLNQFASNYNSFNATANTVATYSDITTFLPNGNSINNFAKQLYPFKDWNANGLYEPSLGEYPIIKGHQQIYSVYNDAFSTHTETGGLPLGIEVHDRSFAYNEPTIVDSMKVINYATFYNYEIINRSNNNYNNIYMTLWIDPDLGYYLDDYIGTDTLNNFGYAYNGDNYDDLAASTSAYGNKLPMMAFALIPNSSALTDGIDNNNNGLIDEPGENFKLNLTTYYNNNIGAFPPATTNPDTTYQYYNYMKGIWKDSSPFKPVGTAYNPTLSVSPTHYVYTGNPQTNAGWTEGTANNLKGDRRILCTVGPFNFPAKKKVEFEYAFVFSRDTSLNNVNNNFSLLQKDVKNVRYYRNLQSAPCTPLVSVGLKENRIVSQNLWIYPNPTTGNIIVNLDHNAENASLKLYDIAGKIIYESTINDTYRTQVSLDNFSAGVYFLVVKEGEFKRVEKIIKQ